jgi:hypothetical protein
MLRFCKEKLASFLFFSWGLIWKSSSLFFGGHKVSFRLEQVLEFNIRLHTTTTTKNPNTNYSLMRDKPN